MRLDIYLPLALAGVFGIIAPSVARRLPPAVATWLLSVGGLVCAAGSTAALGFLGWTLVGQTPDVAARGRSPRYASMTWWPLRSRWPRSSSFPSPPAARAMGLVRGDQLTLGELRNLAREARRVGAAREAEVRLLHGWLPRDPAAVCARASPVGSGGHVALLVEDVTEARRVADMRRDFIANVSHELKTPVGALSLLAEALQQGHDDPNAVRRFADRMRYESTRLARLVTELIELSRLEAADSLPEPAAVPVDQLVAEAVDRTRLAATARHIAVVTVGDTGASVLGHREQLVTAVVNLLDNAIQYSPEHTRVSVAVRP